MQITLLRDGLQRRYGALPRNEPRIQRERAGVSHMGLCGMSTRLRTAFFTYFAIVREFGRVVSPNKPHVETPRVLAYAVIVGALRERAGVHLEVVVLHSIVGRE